MLNAPRAILGALTAQLLLILPTFSIRTRVQIKALTAILVRTTASSQFSHSKFELFRKYSRIPITTARVVLLVDMQDQEQLPLWIQDSGVEIFQYRASYCSNRNASHHFPSVDSMFPQVMRNLSKWFTKGNPDRLPFYKSIIHGSTIDSVSCRLQRNANWFLHELSILLWLNNQSTHFKNVWVAEDDAFFTGDMAKFFDFQDWGKQSSPHAQIDLIGSDMFLADPSKEPICAFASPTFVDKFHIASKGCVRQSEQIVRLSMRSLRVLEANLADEAGAYGESFAPTVCNAWSRCSSLDLRNTDFLASGRCEPNTSGFGWRCRLLNRSMWIETVASANAMNQSRWFTKVGWCDTDRFDFPCNTDGVVLF